MAKVAADLQNIAATLAEAQRSGHVSISGLNARLVQIDNTIAAEIARAQADGVNWTGRRSRPRRSTPPRRSLGEMTAVRDAYGSKLDEAELDMAADGYDTDAIAGGEGEGEPSAEDQAARRRREVRRNPARGRRGAGQQRRPDDPGNAGRRSTPCATSRPSTIPTPTRTPSSTRASASTTTTCRGSSDRCPSTRFSARTPASRRSRASSSSRSWRRDFSVRRRCRRMPRRRSWTAPRRRRASMVLNRAEQQLSTWACPTQGVLTVIKGLGSLSDSIGTGVEQYGTSKETGRHALAGLSKADAELFTKWGGRVGWAGNIAQLVIAGIEYPNNDWNPNEELGKASGGVFGSVLGGMGAGAAVGSFGGPFTAAGAAVIGGLLGGFAGSDIGGGLGANFDPQRYQPRRRRRQLVAMAITGVAKALFYAGLCAFVAWRPWCSMLPWKSRRLSLGVDSTADLLDRSHRGRAAVVRRVCCRTGARRSSSASAPSSSWSARLAVHVAPEDRRQDLRGERVPPASPTRHRRCAPTASKNEACASSSQADTDRSR